MHIFQSVPMWENVSIKRIPSLEEEPVLDTTDGEEDPTYGSPCKSHILLSLYHLYP
jgi:hypothetical protein